MARKTGKDANDGNMGWNKEPLPIEHAPVLLHTACLTFPCAKNILVQSLHALTHRVLRTCMLCFFRIGLQFPLAHSGRNVVVLGFCALPWTIQIDCKKWFRCGPCPKRHDTCIFQFTCSSSCNNQISGSCHLIGSASATPA